MRVCMTDRDVIERIAALWGRAVIPLIPREKHHKIPYVTAIKGSSAVRLMTVVRPLMGLTRRGQIERAIKSWHGRPARRHSATPILEIADHVCKGDCELAWLSGLLEGEGCFTVTRADGHSYPVISLQMCDYEIVRRAADLIGTARLHMREPRYQNWDRTFVAQVSGQQAAQWMIRLQPLMGLRRSHAISSALALYEPIRLVKAPLTCVVDGCDARHRGRGLCHKHYMSWSRDVARGRAPRVVGLR